MQPVLATDRRTLMQGWSAWSAVGALVALMAAFYFYPSAPIFPLSLIVGIICLLLVAGDCRRTHMNRLWWPLLVLVTGVYGTWVYLLVRNSRGLRG